MKSLFLILLLTASSAFAKELLIDSRLTESNPSEVIKAKFNVNETQKTAWVDLVIGEPAMRTEKVKVYGLFLELGYVMIRIGGTFDYTCAGVVHEGGKREIRRVNCDFVTRKEMLNVGGEKVSYLNTYLTYY